MCPWKESFVLEHADDNARGNALFLSEQPDPSSHRDVTVALANGNAADWPFRVLDTREKSFLIPTIMGSPTPKVRYRVFPGFEPHPPPFAVRMTSSSPSSTRRSLTKP